MVGENKTQQSSEEDLEERVVEPKGSDSMGKGIRTQTIG